MRKFKKAMKNISVVAVSTAMLTSAAFAGGPTNYPNDLVDNDKFVGKVVIGDNGAADSAAASLIIDDLKSKFSGDTKQYVITATKDEDNNGGESINAIDDGLHYGDTVKGASPSSFDDDDTDLLKEETFENGQDDTDYTQEIVLDNGKFNYALREDADEEKIKAGIYYEKGDIFANYTLDLDSKLELTVGSASSDEYDDSDDRDEDFLGEDLKIMGKDFTIVELDAGTDGALKELVLLGGSNKVSLAEGEETKVGDYNVKVEYVNEDDVRLTIGGKTINVDKYDLNDDAGVNVGVTDISYSSKDSGTSYVELVIGGQKVSLKEGNIKVNDESLNDIDEYENYDVDVKFASNGFDDLTITYAVDDHTLLDEGDSLIDPLFNAFELKYEGTNEPEYNELKLSTSSDTLSFSGLNLVSGDSIPNQMQFFYDGAEETENGNFYMGDDDYQIFFNSAIMGSVVGDDDGVTATSTTVTFDTTKDNIEDYGFIVPVDWDEQYMYQITNVNSEEETDFDELFADNDVAEVKNNEWADDLEGSGYVTSARVVTFAQLADTVYFEKGLKMDISAAATDELNSTHQNSVFEFSLNKDDKIIDGEDASDENDMVKIGVKTPSKNDIGEEPLELFINDNSKIVNSASGLADVSDDNDDEQIFVTTYGMMITYDNEDKDDLTIAVPEEQVEATVKLNFGEVSGKKTVTYTVTEDQLEAKKEALKDEGYKIEEVEEKSQEEIEIDVDAPVMASEVEGVENLIVVGGPAVNAKAAELLGLTFPTNGADVEGLSEGDAVVEYFNEKNSVLVYGWEAADTKAAVEKLNSGDY